MDCPVCGGSTSVLETRRDSEGGVRRRRRCADCGDRVTTIESVERTLVVRKRDGTIQPFERQKLASSIAQASSTWGRLGVADVNAVVERVERHLVPDAVRGPVPTSRIGEVLLEALAGLPAPADMVRIRYAMVFLGRSDRPDRLSNVQEFLSWLSEEYRVTGADLSTDASDSPAWVTKRDGRRAEPFNAGKLVCSIKLALKSRGTQSQIEHIAQEISQEIQGAFADQPVVSSIQLGAEVLHYLRLYDGLAYLRFASRFKMIADPSLVALDAASVLVVED